MVIVDLGVQHLGSQIRRASAQGGALTGEQRETSSSSPRAGAVLGIIDQGLSSVTNFGASVAAALLLSSEQFGAFAIAYLVYAMVVPGIQAIIGQELVLNTGTSGDRLADVRDGLLFALLLGAGAAICLAGVSIITPGVRGPLLALAIALPALQVQDTIRYAASVMGRMHLAVLSDFAWLSLATGALVTALMLDLSMTPTWFIAIWGGSGAIAAIVPLRAFAAADLPRPTFRRFRDRSYMGYRFIWEYVALRASSQALYIALGGLAGLAATGGLRGAITLFGPLTVVVLAASSFGVPVLRGIAPARRETTLVAVAAALVVICAALTVAVQMTPDALGMRILGDTWEGAHAFAVAVGSQTAFTSISAVVFVALRMVAPRTTLRLRVIPAILLLGFFFAGFSFAGAEGAVWGVAAASAAQAVVALAAYLRLRRRGQGLAFA